MPQLDVRRLARGGNRKQRAARCCPLLPPSEVHAGDACKCSSVLPAPAGVCSSRAVDASKLSMRRPVDSQLMPDAACCSLLPHARSARAFTPVFGPAAAATRRCRQPREAPCCAAVERTHRVLCCKLLPRVWRGRYSSAGPLQQRRDADASDMPCAASWLQCSTVVSKPVQVACCYVGGRRGAVHAGAARRMDADAVSRAPAGGGTPPVNDTDLSRLQPAR